MLDLYMAGSPLCNTLQHAATHCNTLQHTARHCGTLPVYAYMDLYSGWFSPAPSSLYIYIYTHTYIHIYIYIYTYIYVYVYIHIYILTYIYVYVYTYAWVYTHINMNIYMYTHIYTYIYEYIPPPHSSPHRTLILFLLLARLHKYTRVYLWHFMLRYDKRWIKHTPIILWCVCGLRV